MLHANEERPDELGQIDMLLLPSNKPNIFDPQPMVPDQISI